MMHLKSCRPYYSRAVAAALVLLLSACGGSDGSGNSAGADPVAAAAAAGSSAIAAPVAPAPAAATAASGNTAMEVPSGYSIVQASSFGVKCDGSSNDTGALQAALNGLKSNQALQLPSGTCIYSNKLTLYAKNNVMIMGAGKDATVLQATDPLHSSLVISQSDTVALSAFQIYSPNSTSRTTDADSRGVYVEKSNKVVIDGVKVRKVAGAGILYYSSTNAQVTNSVVDSSRADAFHFTGTQNVLAQYNVALNAGDDCFASIGYGTDINRNVQFLDNTCSDNLASGVSFEGTTGGQAYRNKLTRTGVAAIRVASIIEWRTGAVDQIDMRDNVLDDVKTRTDIGHAAIMVFSTMSNVTNVSIANTTITNPRTSTAAQVMDYVPDAQVSGIKIANMTVKSTGTVSSCIGFLNASAILSGNTLNGTSC